MKDYIVKVNDSYFSGVDIDNSYKALPSNCSWINYNKNECDKLMFDKDKNKAKIMESFLNLRSYLDKILTAEKLEYIDISTLEVICVNDDKKVK